MEVLGYFFLLAGLFMIAYGSKWFLEKSGASKVSSREAASEFPSVNAIEDKEWIEKVGVVDSIEEASVYMAYGRYHDALKVLDCDPNPSAKTIALAMDIKHALSIQKNPVPVLPHGAWQAELLSLIRERKEVDQKIEELINKNILVKF